MSTARAAGGKPAKLLPDALPCTWSKGARGDDVAGCSMDAPPSALACLRQLATSSLTFGDPSLEAAYVAWLGKRSCATSRQHLLVTGVTWLAFGVRFGLLAQVSAARCFVMCFLGALGMAGNLAAALLLGHQKRFVHHERMKAVCYLAGFTTSMFAISSFDGSTLILSFATFQGCLGLVYGSQMLMFQVRFAAAAQLLLLAWPCQAFLYMHYAWKGLEPRRVVAGLLVDALVFRLALLARIALVQLHARYTFLVARQSHRGRAPHGRALPERAPLAQQLSAVREAARRAHAD